MRLVQLHGRLRTMAFHPVDWRRIDAVTRRILDKIRVRFTSEQDSKRPRASSDAPNEREPALETAAVFRDFAASTYFRLACMVDKKKYHFHSQCETESDYRKAVK